mmetsp:Transcript_15342/g.43916  ORF Transcript_15342/g.43916 Transcript_15342/m.43916 type:complete len:210 (+) Transcript_15342:205-834(+)
MCPHQRTAVMAACGAPRGPAGAGPPRCRGPQPPWALHIRGRRLPARDCSPGALHRSAQPPAQHDAMPRGARSCHAAGPSPSDSSPGSHQLRAGFETAWRCAPPPRGAGPLASHSARRPPASPAPWARRAPAPSSAATGAEAVGPLLAAVACAPGRLPSASLPAIARARGRARPPSAGLRLRAAPLAPARPRHCPPFPSPGPHQSLLPLR